jgi:hypothetical protein
MMMIMMLVREMTRPTTIEEGAGKLDMQMRYP